MRVEPGASSRASQDLTPDALEGFAAHLAGTPGAGQVAVTDPALIAELVDVAELYVNPYRGDALHGPELNGSDPAAVAAAFTTIAVPMDRVKT